MPMTVCEFIDSLPENGTKACGPETFGISLEAFQAIASDLHRLEVGGKIRLSGEHRESQSGNRWIVFIRVSRS